MLVGGAWRIGATFGHQGLGYHVVGMRTGCPPTASIGRLQSGVPETAGGTAKSMPYKCNTAIR